MNVFTPLNYISGKTIKRTLTASSNILVKEGDKISPSDILAETKPSAGFHIVNVATALNIKPKVAITHIVRKEGERIYKGEILAEKQKLFSKETEKVASPIDGIIQHINDKNGQILLKMIRKQENIPSGVWGKVISINTQNEVEIETQVLEITGKGGRGFERGGSIKVIASPHETIHEHMIAEDYAGKIIVGGSHITREAIGKCVNLGITGIVVGGMDYKDMLAVNVNSDIGVSFIVLEGFGTLPINEDVYTSLKKCDNFYSFVNGKDAKLLVPLESVASAPSQEPSLKLEVGSKVRVMFDTSISQVGIIKELLAVHTFPSGIKTEAVKITNKNTELVVPISNVEILI